MKPGTPLPWDSEEDYEDAFDYRTGHYSRPTGTYRVFMGECEYQDVDGPQTSDEYATVEGVCAKANAAYIVHAANLYPKLEKALRDAIDSLEYVDQAHPGTTGFGVRAERVANMRSLLAECGGA